MGEEKCFCVLPINFAFTNKNVLHSSEKLCICLQNSQGLRVNANIQEKANVVRENTK